MMLETLMGNSENLVGHHEEVRLCPKEHSGHRRVLKQGKIGRFPNLRTGSCVTENAIDWEIRTPRFLVPVGQWVNCVGSLLPCFLVYKMGTNACLTTSQVTLGKIDTSWLS